MALELKDLNLFRSIMPPLEAQRLFDEINKAQNSNITKESIGLGNVDNTSDASKPVSSAAQTALDAKAPIANPTFTGTVNGITKGMVGLSSVDNTADASKPVSAAQQTALNAKVATTVTVNGHALSSNVEVTKGDVGLGNVNNIAVSAVGNASANLEANVLNLKTRTINIGGTAVTLVTLD